MGQIEKIRISIISRLLHLTTGEKENLDIYLVISPLLNIKITRLFYGLDDFHQTYQVDYQ